MTQLGKALVFYLKYMAEMNHLYDPEGQRGEVDLAGLDDPKQVREKALAVGGAACSNAAAFLEECGKGIEAHFTRLGIATFSNKAKRATVVRKWNWYIKVYGSRPHGWFYCGVFLSDRSHVPIRFVEEDDCGFVVPYLWLKDRHKGAEGAWSILSGWPHPRAGVGLFEDSRTLVLACIPIKPKSPESYDADREPLIDEVMRTIALIGAEQTRAIASFAAGLKEPDEG